MKTSSPRSPQASGGAALTGKGQSGHWFARPLGARHPSGASGPWSVSKVCWGDNRTDKGLLRAPVRAAMSESKATWLQTQRSVHPSHPDPTPAFPTAGFSSAERKRGGRTEGRQGANHLQRTTCLLEFKMTPGFKSQWTQIPFLFPPGEANDNLN